MLRVYIDSSVVGGCKDGVNESLGHGSLTIVTPREVRLDEADH